VVESSLLKVDSIAIRNGMVAVEAKADFYSASLSRWPAHGLSQFAS